MSRHNHHPVGGLALLAFSFMLIVGASLPAATSAQEPTPTSEIQMQEVQCGDPDNTALDHYWRATEFDHAGKNVEAAQEYLWAIQCDNDYVMAYRGLARAYQLQKRTDEAIRLFEQMSKNDPRNALAHYSIGWLHMQADEWEKAESEFQAALAIDPKCAIALNGMGVVYGHKGDNKAALATYRIAMAADPGLEFPRGNILRFTRSLTKEQTASLIASSEESLSLDPKQEFADEKRYIIGALHDQLGQWDQARQSWQRLLSEYPSSLWCDYAYMGIALSYANVSQWKQAVEPLTIGIDRFPNSALAGPMRILLGIVHLQLGNDNEAYHYITEGYYEYPDFESRYAADAQKILQSLETNTAEVYRLTAKGRAAKDSADFDQALKYCEQARQIAVSRGFIDGEMEAVSCLGTTTRWLGRFSDAQVYQQKFLELAMKVGDEYDIGLAYSNLAIAVDDLGEYYKAISYHEQALAHYKQVPDTQKSPDLVRQVMIKVYDNLGVTYAELGHYELARDWMQRALDEGSAYRQTANDRVGTITRMDNLGILYGEMGEHDRAVEYLVKALKLSEEEKQLGQMLGTLHENLGEIYMDTQQFDKALGEFRTLHQIAAEVQNPFWELMACKGTGRIYGKQEKYEDSLAEFRKAYDIAHDLKLLSHEIDILQWMGQSYDHLGQKAAAMQYYRDAISLGETLAGELSAGETRAELSRRMGKSLYSDLVIMLADSGKAYEAFELSEHARARTFLDSMANGRIDFREGADIGLITKEQTLRAEIVALDTRLQDQARQPRSKQDVQVMGRLQDQLEAKRTEYSLLLSQIQATNPEYASLVMVSTLGVTETQHLLDGQTTLLEYFVAPEETIVFVLTHDSFDAITIPVGSEQLKEQITIFRDFANRAQPHPESLVKLYGWLITPVRPYLHTPVLGIVPHGVLHYLPFAALTDGKRYLVNDFALFSLPSASVLRFVQKRATQTSSGLLAVAQPDAGGLSHLEYATQEAKTIAAMWQTQALVGSDATETMMYTRTANVGIVHVAAHGEFNSRNPLFSAIMLGADNENDGRLEVHEIYRLDLTQANLVVLSGCETDIGHLTEGDELVGLNRALLFAGTPTVVGSLWKVDDKSTSFLMERFYTHLRDGMSKAEALRYAQLDAMKQYPYPYHWAGFVLTGDGKQKVVTQLSGFNVLWLILLGLVIVGMVGYWWQVYRKRAQAHRAMPAQDAAEDPTAPETATGNGRP